MIITAKHGLSVLSSWQLLIFLRLFNIQNSNVLFYCGAVSSSVFGEFTHTQAICASPLCMHNFTKSICIKSKACWVRQLLPEWICCDIWAFQTTFSQESTLQLFCTFNKIQIWIWRNIKPILMSTTDLTAVSRVSAAAW